MTVRDSLSHRLAELEGAEAALVLASGMAATTCSILALLRPGDHLLASSLIRESTRTLLQQELPALGVAVSFIDPRDTRGWRRGLERTTRVLLLETPSMEDAQVVDCKPPRMLARELGIALLVDSTAASPVLFRPLDHGADVVIHDAAFLLDGAGGNAAGVVCGSEGVIEEVRAKMLMWGAVPHPAALAQLDRELDTLEVRVQRQSASTATLAAWAASQSSVQRVDAPLHHDNNVTRAGSTTLVLRLDSVARATRCLDVLIGHEPTPTSAWRGTHSTHAVRAAEASAIRLYVGLEAPELLMERLAEALS